jgi:SAM-dependent methyltransferase
MSQSATMHGASAPDRLARLIQERVFGDRVKIPVEVRLWGGRTYRFGAGEPAVKILVKDRKGLSALRRLNELRICEAYMNGSLDVQGDMLGFASLRPGLHDHHPLNDLIDRRQLPCRVVNQDFLAYRSPEPYDAIVILGVMEHLPDYPAVLRQCQRLLKPGGRVYLDASASRDKYDKPSFIARYIFPADHAFLCLHDFLHAVAKSPMEVLAVHNDRHNYFLTCKAWAENLDAARDEIIRRWGETLYRRFRLYLWGSAQAFLSRGAEAFRVVLERPLET